MILIKKKKFEKKSMRVINKEKNFEKYKNTIDEFDLKKKIV